ncbi:MAG: PIN domain-containing protein [Deltaproteobacteria bacterium]|nr:PIN domain-containing protein [Deltaproteobacteria bacterium]MDL1960911.1 PIN domain-containing protein [Deltaproteobacteria bacterium]
MDRNTLFVDTGAWYALADSSDQYHDEAVKIYPKLLGNYHPLKTTNLIVAEIHILIRRCIGYQAAIAFLENIASSPRIVKIYSDSMLEERAESILRQYQDQDFSYTDAVSFVVMKQYGITEAFSFDKHFVTAGFTLIP